MWMLPLYLHINQKSIYDDNDDDDHYKRKAKGSKCFPFRIDPLEKTSYQENSVRKKSNRKSEKLSFVACLSQTLSSYDMAN